MDKKRNSAAGAATPDNAENIRNAQREHYKDILSKIIPFGKGNSVSMARLSAHFRTSERDIRAMIHRARCEGAIICGDEAGYYQPETQEELLHWYKLAKRRSLSGLKALKAARKRLREQGFEL